jgi:ATP-dependent RNA helicase SUPV3L1/SUV3
VIAEGEVLQLSVAKNMETTEDDYLEVIRAKTAALFAAAAEVGPIIAGADRAGRNALKSYGMNLGLAFQLVESLGVLFRRDVADDVKALDQDARASMRKHGIRFGAYHIFMPALLKPAPAELITLLWALKNDGLDKPGYGDLIPVLAAGRTSVVTDPAFERAFYKLAGFRFLGKRAVRIDILERLADLIRPLLQWKPGTPRPEGAYDGRRFMATTAMLSILGATPDDMEEILKGLGYRADAVKAEEVTAFLAAQAPAEAATETPAEAGAEASDEHDADASETESEAPAEKPEAPAAETAEAPAAEAPAETEAAAATEGEPAEVKPVLLWRPGSRHDNQRQGGQRQGDRQGQGERRGGERHRNQPAGERGERREGGRGGRPDQAKGRDGKPQGGNRPDRGERNERGGKPQQAKFEARPPRKEKPIDPDSPFAKLAALKEQMKK